MVGRIIKWVCTLGIVGGSVAATTRWGPSMYAKWFQKEGGDKREAVRYATASRTDLKITVVEDGKLRAKKNHPVFPQLRGQSRIAWLAPEGSSVKKGDKVAEFESKNLKDTLQQQQTDLEGAKREIVVKEEAVTIQRATTRAAVSAAENKHSDAKAALDVYRNLEGPKKINELETAINDARGKLTNAQKSLAEAQ